MVNEKILAILANPKNVGQMRDADGVGKVKGEKCHDFSKLFIKVEDRTITETRFQTYGNAVSIAAVSVVSELIKGKTIDEILQIKLDEVLAQLGNITHEQKECVESSFGLIPSCVNSYYRKLEKKNIETETEEKPIKEVKAKQKQEPKTQPKEETKQEEKTEEEPKQSAAKTIKIKKIEIVEPANEEPKVEEAQPEEKPAEEEKAE